MLDNILKNKSSNYIKQYQWFKTECQKFRSFEQNVSNWDQTNRNFSHTSKKQFETTTPLSKLNLIAIYQLKLQKVHKGNYLKLKFILPCFKLNAICGLCEDHTGNNCIEISIYNFNLKGKHYDNYFNVNTTIYVKQPFYKTSATGTHIIRIDNPKDIQFDFDHKIKNEQIFEKGNEKQQINIPSKLTLQEEYREEGIALMNEKQYVQAYLLYSRAISETDKQQYLLKFLLNKAIVCSKLNLISEYGTNIKEAFKIQPKNKKVIYHLIKQRIMANLFQQALKILNENKQIISKDNLNELLKLLKIRKSFRQNKIDWYRAIKFSEIGEYFSDKICIGKSPFGRGIITKKTISAGQLLIVQSPLLFLEDEGRGQNIIKWASNSNDNKMKLNMKKLYQNSLEFKQRIKFLSSKWSQRQYDEKRQLKIQNLQELNDVLETNWFELNQLNEFFQFNHKSSSIGLYQKISMINHCCEYNCQRFSLGTTMVIYAVKNINEGQQIFVAYNRQSQYQQRNRKLQFWNITCKCIFCKEQKQQLQNGRLMGKVTSIQLQKLKMIEHFQIYKKPTPQIKRLNNFYDMYSVSIILIFGGNISKAAEIFRSILTMSQSESMELMYKFLKE